MTHVQVTGPSMVRILVSWVGVLLVYCYKVGLSLFKAPINSQYTIATPPLTTGWCRLACRAALYTSDETMVQAYSYR